MNWLRIRLSATLLVVQGRQSPLFGARAFVGYSGGTLHWKRYDSSLTRAVNKNRVRPLPPKEAQVVMSASVSTGEGGSRAGGRSSDGSSKANRLAGETSPYLLQHAHNPVDWMPWGEEAFRKAREEEKPIFLSIGYSTCHW